LLSKEQALMLPLLAAAYEHFYRPDRSVTSLRQKLRRYAPLFLLGAAYVAFRALALGGFAPSVSRPEMSASAVLLSALALLGQYFWKLIWPLHLSAFYVFHESGHFGEPPVVAGMAGLLACLILFLWLWRRAQRAHRNCSLCAVAFPSRWRRWPCSTARAPSRAIATGEPKKRCTCAPSKRNRTRKSSAPI
jgi:hypothetical protein